MTDDLHALARRKVREYTKPGPAGFIAYCRECVTVMSGSGEFGTMAVPFRLWPEQERFAGVLTGNKRVIALKARQLGMTTEVLAFWVFRSLFWMDQDFRIVSINETEAKLALERVKFMIANLPAWCAPELEVSNTTTVKIAETGSVIRAMASTKNAGRGQTLTGLLLDEDAAQVYSDMIVTAALPALEKRGGWMIRLSTANGVGNSFERCWRQSERGEGGFAPIFVNWRADPGRDDAWYAGELERQGREYMSQEYPETAGEAFLASGRPFFDMDRVSRDLGGHLPEWEDGYLDGREFVRQARGVVRVWRRPEVGRRYVIFADVAEGLETGDWSNAYVMPVCDAGAGEVLGECARVRTKCDPEELADVLYLLGEWYSYVPNGPYEGGREPALLAVEANNHGIATTKRLQALGYGRLYYQRDLVLGTVKERVGWLTTGPSRRLMLGEFQGRYRRGEERVYDRECLEEMANFFHRGSAGKPQAGPGQHDDCVMSRAGACYVARMEALPGEATTLEEAMPELTAGRGLDYWRRVAEKRAEERKVDENRGVVELGG